LISKEIYFQEITLTEPDGNVIRFNEEDFNFSDMMKSETEPTSDSVKTNEEDEPWEIFIQKFELKRLRLLVSDRAVNLREKHALIVSV